MKISVSQKIRTGLFVTGCMLLLLFLVFLIGKRKNMFSDTFPVYANFKNISGIKEGNYARFAGINVGTVDNISIINDTTVRILLVLQKSIRPYLKADATASIGSDGLMGDKLILIAHGSDSSGLLKEGGQLKTADPVDIDKMMRNLTKIAENAETLTGSLAGVVDKINSGQGSIGRLINDDKLAKNLEGTISSTQETVSRIKKTASSVTDNMEAAKHSFLFRGYFRKKEKRRVKDSTDKANVQPLSLKKDKD
jgi:phospholipid/cholesterol/gamma-HCH transport system substrate-binding protein